MVSHLFMLWTSIEYAFPNFKSRYSGQRGGLGLCVAAKAFSFATKLCGKTL